MKSNFFKLLFSAVAILVTVGIFQSCQKLEDVADDVSLVLDTDLLYHPLMIQYVDAAEDGWAPQELEIEILGPDKDKVRSLLGGQEIVPDRNYVNIGVRKIETPSVDNPLEITVVAKAPGYIPSIHSFVIHSTDMQFATIPMVKIGQNAPGITTETTSFNVAATGAAQTTKFDSGLDYGKQEKATVTVPEGAKVFNANGKELQGEVEVVMAHFDNRHDVAQKAYAGGANTSKNIIDVDGTDLGPGMIIPYGAMTLDMYVNNEEVKTFSKPLKVKMTLNPNSINPLTNQPIQEGDEVVVASYLEQTAEWKIETRETVTRNAQGQLEVSYNQPHLSTWVVGAAVPPGCFFFQATVQSPIPAFSTVQRFYYVELRDNATNALLSTNFLRLKNNEIVTFFFVPNTTARVDVYDGNSVCEGGLIAQSDPLNLCGFVGLINVNDDPAFKVNEILKAHVEVSGICNETTPTLVVAPTLTILYKDTDDCDETEWSPLGVVSGGVGTTTKLRVGNHYDFRIAQGGINRTIRDIPVPTQDSTFNVNYTDSQSGGAFTFTQVIDVNYTPGPGGVGQEVNFVFHDIDIPDCACEIWRCHQAGGDPDTCDPMNPATHPCNN
ncbi:MAG: hypothetical protein D6714_10465 [Bacteroidetes bacterium]|nr:MAG: hypothetical protein D6714_10465 [Bacteroidota bacterium]